VHSNKPQLFIYLFYFSVMTREELGKVEEMAGCFPCETAYPQAYGE